MVEHQQTSYWKWDFLRFSNSYWKCRSCVDSSTKHKITSICVHYWMWTSWEKIEDVVHSLFKWVFVSCLFLNFYLTTHEAMKRSYQLTLTCLNLTQNNRRSFGAKTNENENLMNSRNHKTNPMPFLMRKMQTSFVSQEPNTRWYLLPIAL